METSEGNTKPSLVILAAGMGSRYGALKQMDGFGPNGETILDYSIYDAIQAGFGKVVFVVREWFKEEFKGVFSAKFDDLIDVRYVTQELDKLPEGVTDIKGAIENRQKPWGTAHAVWVAHEAVDEPFAVINADDFYGRESYTVIKSFFDQSRLSDPSSDYALVAYDLIKTLSEHGTVNRGICTVDEHDYLSGIVETLKVAKSDNHEITFPDQEGGYQVLPSNTPVSMNMWAFYPSYFDHFSRLFPKFLANEERDDKSEYYIPMLIDSLIASKEKKVKVLRCTEDWFGVTYKEDKPFVSERLNKLIETKVYPQNLWLKR